MIAGVLFLLASGFSLGVGLAHFATKRVDEETPRCWICGKTFSQYKALYYHHRANHDDPMSAVLPKDSGPYRRLP